MTQYQQEGQDRVLLYGSNCPAVSGAAIEETIAPDECIYFTVYLRRKPGSAPPSLEDHMEGDPGLLSHEELEALLGAHEQDILDVSEFAASVQLTVDRVDKAGRAIHLHGRAGAINEAFGIELNSYWSEGDQVSFRGYEGDLSIPAYLLDMIVCIGGLENYPGLRPHVRVQDMAAIGSGASYLPAEVAAFYSFPKGVDGKGQSIAIIELSGGYDPATIQSYFSGQANLKVPVLNDISVDGASNQPGTAPDYSGGNAEVYLDIEVAGSVANGATLNIYFCQFTYQSFVNAVTAAVKDKTANNSVISISWGGREVKWPSGLVQQMESILNDAVSAGITVCVSTGDQGANCGAEYDFLSPDMLAHVEYPASSPWVLACGGTTMYVQNGILTHETVWNNPSYNGGVTGGGVSEQFPSPHYQVQSGITTVSANLYSFVTTTPVVTGDAATSPVPGIPPPGITVIQGRAIPDVAANADQRTGYKIACDGLTTTMGGTSAAAPLWAALIALLNQQLNRRIGFFTRILYSEPSVQQALNDIVFDSSLQEGNNNINGGRMPGYTAGNGWDACTGWGTPNGTKLYLALSAYFAAKAAKPQPKTTNTAATI